MDRTVLQADRYPGDLIFHARPPGFERLIGTPKFRIYIAAVSTRADPLAAFEGLVGRPLPAFEATGTPTC